MSTERYNEYRKRKWVNRKGERTKKRTKGRKENQIKNKEPCYTLESEEREDRKEKTKDRKKKKKKGKPISSGNSVIVFPLNFTYSKWIHFPSSFGMNHKELFERSIIFKELHLWIISWNWWDETEKKRTNEEEQKKNAE